MPISSLLYSVTFLKTSTNQETRNIVLSSLVQRNPMRTSANRDDTTALDIGVLWN